MWAYVFSDILWPSEKHYIAFCVVFKGALFIYLFINEFLFYWPYVCADCNMT